MKTTHKHRAVQKLEALGWLVADVEKYHAFARRSFDLFGCLDLLAIRAGETLGVQVTSPPNVGAHVTKMLAEPRLVDCLRAGWRIELWGIRNQSVRDGSFALARVFELTNGGKQVSVYQGSDVLAERE